MDTEIIVECPLGSKCEEIKDNKIHRCRWFIKIRGKNPQSEELIEEWDCAMAWLPIVMVENAQTNRGQTLALETFRNEVVKNQKEFNFILFNELSRRKNLEALEEKIALMVLENKDKDREISVIDTKVIENKEE